MQTQPSHTQDEHQTLVSFIIPVYNVPGTMLQECVKSLMRLSLRPFEREIIIVDDGSQNNTLDDLKGMTDDVIYVKKKNGGVSSARNLGLQLAQGKYVQFVDGDDFLLQPPYEHVLDLARYHDADMIMFDFTDTNTQHGLDYSDEGPYSGAELMSRANIHGSVWGYIFRRNILGALQFTTGFAYGEDEEFTPQLLLRAEHVFRTSAKAYFYRTRPSSATNAQDTRSTLKRLNDAKEVILSLYRKGDTMQTVDRKAMQRRVAQLTMDYIYNIIVLTRDKHYLDKQLDELRGYGLFPLPDQNYTAKYKWFRWMSSSNVGLVILMRTLPIINRER